MTQKRPHSASFPIARRNVATNPETAPVDSLAPANGIVRASQLFDGVYSCSDSKLVAMLRDAQHRVLGLFVGHPLGQPASLFGSLVPIFGVVDIRCNGHGTRPFADRERPQGSRFHDDAPGGVTSTICSLGACLLIQVNGESEK